MDTYPVAPDRGHLMVTPQSWNREADDPATAPTFCHVGRHSAPAETVRNAPCGGTICDACNTDKHINSCKACKRAELALGVYQCPTCRWLSRSSYDHRDHVAAHAIPAPRNPLPEGAGAVCADCGLRCRDEDLAPTYECDDYGDGLLCPSCHNAHVAACVACRLDEFSYAEPLEANV